MAVRQFSIIGSLAAGGREVMIGQGAHADDLPPDDAGIVEIADRVRQHYGKMYDESAAQWMELHVWENEPPHDAIRELHIERGMGAPEVHPLSEDTP